MHSPSYSPQMLQLLSRKMDRDVIDYLVSTTTETVDVALGRPTSCLSIPRTFLQLTLNVIRKSRIDTPVVLVALVYLERAKPRYKISDERWACEKILIGALVLAAKYVSDYTIRNARWARWSGIFSKEEVGRMERDLLNILDWNLSIAEGDIMAHHEHLSPPTLSCSLPPASLKRPRSQLQKDPTPCLELSPFCPPPPANHAAVLAKRTRALTSSVTLPGFSSFLHNPYMHPPVSSLSSLQSSLPSFLPVTAEEERAHKRPRLVTNSLGPRQPLSLENNHRNPVPVPPQQPTDPRIFKSLGLPLAWPKAFDPFVLPYIPPVSFYES